MNYVVLAILLLFAVISQFVLYLTSEKVKNPYNKKHALICVVLNLALNIGLYVASFHKISSWKEMLDPVIYLIAFSFLVSITIIDFKDHEIPNEYNLALLVLGMLYLVTHIGEWKGLLLGGVASLVLYFVLFIFSQGNLGMGDVKLGTVLGFMLGIGNFANFLMISFFSGAIISLILLVFKIKKKDDKIAFGPYICLAYVAIVFMQLI